MSESSSKDVRDLIARVQGGDQDVLEVLRGKYLPLIESSAYRFYRDDMSAQDREDILEEALINFCNAVYSYELSLEGVEFGLYAKICIDNGLVSFMRSFDRRKRILEVSLSELDGEGDKEHRDMLDILADREQAVILAKRISERLSKYENRVWWLYVSGLTVCDIALRISAEPKSVSNAIFRIRRKLGDMIESDKK
ncbi:MAG: hypothetical protein J6L83_01230 [Clostridia bacterium]|nr:hypothetical protein [Clostridia bacterium]